jgi:putative acetyltransferase
MNKITVRAQRNPEDLTAIGAVNDAAFDRHGQTRAFDEFRASRDDIISLVAEIDNQVIAHVLFSPATLTTDNHDIAGMGLAQLAVLPEYQRQGIGQQLTHAGLDLLRADSCPFVIVVGHASYYPRFGFEPGITHGLKCQWESIPDDSFMVLYPDPETRPHTTGTAYFNGLSG